MDHFAFEFDLRIGKVWVPNHVADHAGECGELVGIGTSFVGRLVLASAGVDLAADIFDFESQIASAAAVCALEDHVFDEMREAYGQIGFIAAASGHMNGE